MRADAVQQIETQKRDYAAARSRDPRAEPDEPGEEGDWYEVKNSEVQTRRRKETDQSKSDEADSPDENQCRLRPRCEPRRDGATQMHLAPSLFHSGMTAVASISTLATSSTSALTTTTDIAGKCLPMTSR